MMKPETERLQLREVCAADVPEIHKLHSFAEVDRYNTLGIPESIEQTQKLVARWIDQRNAEPPQRFVFCIENGEKAFIGLIGLKMSRPAYRSAEIWYKLLPAYWNYGCATKVVKAILHFGFIQLQLHRIEAGCATENLASVRVLEKAGLRREGLKRQLLPIRGQWFDNYFYAILDVDYKQLL